MYGLIQSCLRSLVLQDYGVESWNKVLEKCPDISDDADFLHYKMYPDSLCYRLVGVVSEVTDLSADEVMVKVGEHFLPFAVGIGFGDILHGIGQTFEGFLQNIDYLHWYLMSTAFTGIQSPSFRPELAEKDGSQLVLHYYSRRDCCTGIVTGLLAAIARDIFNVHIKIQQLSCDSQLISNKRMLHCRFQITQYPVGMPLLPMKWVRRWPQMARRQKVEPRQQVAISGPMFSRLHPYHIVFDRQLTIVQTGCGLATLLPETQRTSARLDHLFTLTWPEVALTLDNVETFMNLMFQMVHTCSGSTESKKSVPSSRKSSDSKKSSSESSDFRLKGSIVPLEGEVGSGPPLFLFLGTPLARSVKDLEKMSLKISDIPCHDSTRDLILLKDQRNIEFDVMQQLETTTSELSGTAAALQQEMKKTDKLLHSMIPPSVADKLKRSENVQETYEEVTILFSDIVTFTQIAASCTPFQVVQLLNQLYTFFDEFTEQNGVYKVETIGDAYMAVGGCPEPNPEHAVQMAQQADQMIRGAAHVTVPNTGQPVQIRVGMHTGPVVAGIVGVKMPRFCLFGDTVNTAARMESHGLPGHIHVSSCTYNVKKGSSMFGNPNALPGLGNNQTGARFQQRAPPPPQAPPQRSPFRPPPAMPPPMPVAMGDGGSGRRIDALEQRLMAAEQANRSLLDELMRMQQDTKVNVKKNEHTLMEERDSRGRLEMAMRGTQGKMAEIDERLVRTEGALKETKNAIQSLVMHTKNVERAVMTSSGETADRRDQLMTRLQEMRHEISGLNQSKDSLERLSHSLREDTRELHMKLENLQGDMQAVDHAVKLQGRLMEDNARTVARGSGSSGGGGGGIKNSVAMALEDKVVKLQQNVMDANSRLVHESKNRDVTDQQQTQRINDLWSELGDLKRRREDDLRDLELKSKELSSLSDGEKKRLQMAISGVQTDLDRRLKQQGDKLRGEAGERIRGLETSLEEEISARTSREKELRDEVEKKLEEIKVYGDEGLNGIRKMTEAEHDQTRQRFKELNDGLNLLESSFNQDKLEIEQKLAKEQQERENLEKVMDAKVEDLSDRLRMGMGSLQSALGEASTKGGPAPLPMEEIERLQQQNSEGVREQMAKSIADVDSKIAALRTRVEQQDEVIENKLKQAERSEGNENSMMGDKLTQKMDSVLFQQERLKRQVDQLEDSVKECPREVAEVKEQAEETEKKLTKKMEQETRERAEDVEDIRRDLARLAGTDENAGNTSLARVQQDVEDTQTSVNKLAEALQVVKSTLGERVKDEKRLREEETSILKQDIDRLNVKAQDLKERIKHPKDDTRSY